jgi:hypothetical protein
MPEVAQPDFAEMRVAVFTSSFQIHGSLHLYGALQTFLNDEQKPTLSVFGADVIALDASNQLHMTHQEMFIHKPGAQVVLFETMPPQGSLTLPPHTESLVMYVDRFAVSGKFYMGQDVRLGDFIESGKQQYLPLTDVKMYPLFAARPGLMTTAPLAEIHRTAIRLYHKA